MIDYCNDCQNGLLACLNGNKFHQEEGNFTGQRGRKDNRCKTSDSGRNLGYLKNLTKDSLAEDY